VMTVRLLPRRLLMAAVGRYNRKRIPLR
jgi:hypothetical protein